MAWQCVQADILSAGNIMLKQKYLFVCLAVKTMQALVPPLCRVPRMCREGSFTSWKSVLFLGPFVCVSISFAFVRFKILAAEMFENSQWLRVLWSLNTWETWQEGSYFERHKHLPSEKLKSCLGLLKTDVCHVIGHFWKSWLSRQWCFEHVDHSPFLELRMNSALSIALLQPAGPCWWQSALACGHPLVPLPGLAKQLHQGTLPWGKSLYPVTLHVCSKHMGQPRAVPGSAQMHGKREFLTWRANIQG